MPRKGGEYERVEEYLEEIDKEIEAEYGERYAELPAKRQVQVLLDRFFKGLPEYWDSAVALREGLEYYWVSQEKYVNVDIVVLRGREHKVIRDIKTGRFRKWLRE